MRGRLGVGVLAGLVACGALASCWHGRTPSSEADETETETKRRDPWDRNHQDTTQQQQQQREKDHVQFLNDSEPTDPAHVPAPGTYVIAGCNTGCKHCALGGKTNVHGVDVKTGKELFPHANGGAGGGGISCSASVPLKTHVRLVAKSDEGLVLETWRPFNSDDYCPCAGTAQPVCDVVVTEQIAAKYKRVYCGADWKQQASAQIGH
jgi:hypothetical protein